jgi:hypothetical protein
MCAFYKCVRFTPFYSYPLDYGTSTLGINVGCILSPTLLVILAPYPATTLLPFFFLFQMMRLMKFAEEQEAAAAAVGDNIHHNPPLFCVAWLQDGKSFVIRNPDEFTRHILPKYFKKTKFSSFTRKLYRWGFRQVNRGIGPDDPIIFGNALFQRQGQAKMAQMKSVTAASTRKAETFLFPDHTKRPNGHGMGGDPKRAFWMPPNAHGGVTAAGLYQQHMQLHRHNFPQMQTGGGVGGGGTVMPGMKPWEVALQANNNNMNPHSHHHPNNALLHGFPNFGQGGAGGTTGAAATGATTTAGAGAAVPPLPNGTQNGGTSNGTGQPNNPNPSFPSAASTAEIVNAAIKALRYAS